MVIDRLIARSAFHSPEMPDLTKDIIDMLKERKGEKPVAFPTSRRAARAVSRLCTYWGTGVKYPRKHHVAAPLMRPEQATTLAHARGTTVF